VKRGRPRKPEADRLTEPIHVRVTGQEFDAIYQRATAARVSFPNMVRALLRAALFRETKSEM